LRFSFDDSRRSSNTVNQFGLARKVGATVRTSSRKILGFFLFVILGTRCSGRSYGSQERINTAPVHAPLEVWKVGMGGTHPPKSPLHKGARSWKLYCFPALCSQIARTTHQLYDGIDKPLWLGFTYRPNLAYDS